MIPIKTKQDINIMREGGRILAQIVNELKEKVAPDITTNDLNRAAEALVFKYKAAIAALGVLLIVGLIILIKVPDTWEKQKN